MGTKLTLSGGVNYEGEVNNFLAAKVIALVEQDKQIGQQQAEQTQVEPELLGYGLDKRQSIFSGKGLIEAFSQAGVKSLPHRIAVAGQRAMEESGKDIFTSKDVIEQFKSGGIYSKNLARDIKTAISQGLIFTVTGKKGSYKITETASRAFSGGFENTKLIGTKNSSRRAKKGGVVAKLEISKPVKDLQIESTLQGYPDYHNLVLKNERIIWLLIFAAKNDIVSLNSKEIQYLSQEVSDNLSISSLPALTVSLVKKGYIAKNSGQFRVLHKGDEYIKGRHEEI